MVRKVAVHVAEDPHSNMFITTKDLETQSISAFILSGQGISRPETAEKVMHEEVTHKYSGVYSGTEENLQTTLLKNSEETEDNKTILERSGVKGLKEGKGRTLKVAGVAGLTVLGAVQGFQLGTMYSEFSTDGVVDAGEWLQLTGEAVMGQLNPVRDVVGDIGGGVVEAAGEGSGVVECMFSGLLGAFGL